MRRLVLLTLATGLAVLGLGSTGSEASTGAPGHVTIVQAVPGATVDVAVDGRSMAQGAAVGAVLGPFDLSPGSHDLSFTGGDVAVDTTVTVDAGKASDVVLHLPADVGGAPVVHTYAAPDGPIGPGKARVLLAHTATVAPADVEVDGQTVFTNIANGEFADADVPEGTIEVALLPSGQEGDPILGPLDVDLQADTLSMIYAYGNPRDGSMNVIAHVAALAPDGSVQPDRIDTGSAGLVGGTVTTFSGVPPHPAGGALPWGLLGALLVVVSAGVIDVRRRRRTSAG